MDNKQWSWMMDNKQWSWMMDYCLKKRLPPCQSWAWEEARGAWEEQQDIIEEELADALDQATAGWGE